MTNIDYTKKIPDHLLPLRVGDVCLDGDGDESGMLKENKGGNSKTHPLQTVYGTAHKLNGQYSIGDEPSIFDLIQLTHRNGQPVEQNEPQATVEPPRPARCEDCRWYKENEMFMGTCQRYEPTVSGTFAPHLVWPGVSRDDWCQYFKPSTFPAVEVENE